MNKPPWLYDTMPEDERALLEKLLDGEALDTLTSKKLTNKAMFRSSREQRLEAAVLWAASTKRSLAEGESTFEVFENEHRAAWNYSAAGRHDRAAPVYEAAIAGLEGYDGEVASAFDGLLEYKWSAGDREGFVSLFRQAVERCAKEELEFPLGYQTQETLLEHCVACGFDEGTRYLIDRIRSRLKRAPKALLQKLQKLEAALAKK